MTVDTWTLTGEKLEKTTLPGVVFGIKVDEKLLAVAVRVYLSNQRKGHARTKTRGEIAKTTAKMYRQKGTGRARHGAYSAPIFVGGGVSHGPDGLQNYSKVLPEKVRKLALLQALSSKASEKKVVVVSGVNKATGKTHEIAGLIKKAGWAGKVLVVGTKDQRVWSRGWKNIGQITWRAVEQINTYTVLNNSHLIMTTEAVKELAKLYAN